MLLGDVLNVFLGLALTFAVVSGFASAITEAMASLVNLRAKTLAHGLGQLLNDPNYNAIAGALLQHNAVNPLSQGTGVQAAQATMPSYVSPGQFAAALLDIVQNPPSTAVLPAGQVPPTTVPSPPIMAAISQLADPQLRAWLQGVGNRAGGTLTRMEDEIAEWFDASMDRVSGVYKRKTQAISLIIGVLVAAALNVDAFHLVVAIWGHPAVMAQAVGSVTSAMPPADAFNALAKDFPVGWGNITAAAPFDWPTWILRMFGWLATGVATLYGAPFWFDVVQKFANIRSTGPAAAKP